VDPLVPLWLIAIASIAGGALVGVLFERRFGNAARRAQKLEAELADAHAEFARYREDTTRHFGKSAELLGRMATDYREFLDHFMHGAEELCGPNVKEIDATTLERPLLDGATTPATAPPLSADTDPLAEPLPK
jgi:uncharacterized membrane-anchored protein YhcB (DUF1043 family)